MKVTKKHQPIDSHRTRGSVGARKRTRRNNAERSTRAIPSPQTSSGLSIPGIS